MLGKRGVTSLVAFSPIEDILYYLCDYPHSWEFWLCLNMGCYNNSFLWIWCQRLASWDDKWYFLFFVCYRSVVWLVLKKQCYFLGSILAHSRCGAKELLVSWQKHFLLSQSWFGLTLIAPLSSLDPHPKGTLKLNIDGSFLEDFGCLGVGGVVRNHDGFWLFLEDFVLIQFKLYNPKKARNAPYFLRFSDYKIWNCEKLFFFHPITKEKLSSNSKIRKSQGHFRKKKIGRARNE